MTSTVVRRILRLFPITLCCAAMSLPLAAQEKTAPPNDAPQAEKKPANPSQDSAEKPGPGEGKPAGGAKKPKIPEPVKFQTITKNTGLQLSGTYFESNLGKEAVPIILLHGWKETGSIYYPFAKQLQEDGCAVIVPDLRGHGNSRQAVRARDGVIDPDKMSKVDLGLIVNEDLEAIKSFLMEQHNAGKLNIELLTVIGFGEGCLFGASWALKDWDYVQLPGIKQGQDVKAVVMVSPILEHKGLNVESVFRNPLYRQMSVLVVAGSKSSQRQPVNRIVKTLEKSHQSLKDPNQAAQSNLWVIEPDTSLDQHQLLYKVPSVPKVIRQFIDLRIKAFANQVPWMERKKVADAAKP